MKEDVSSPTEEAEPLLSIAEVAGIKFPEQGPVVEDDRDVSSLSPYDKWSLLKDKESLYEVTKSLKPTIDSVVASLGGTGNPQIAARARVIAAKAVSSYSPDSGASLPTWVSQQLRQLTRDIRKSNSMVRIPDGVQQDGYAIYKAEKEFEDKYGREPSVEELSDLAHLSIKRIKDVRTKMRPVINSGATETEDGSSTLQLAATDYTEDALDYVYNDSDLNDKKIIEHTVGYGGAEILNSSQLMKKLKLTPVQLSRRKARLSMRINDIINDLESV